MIPRHRLNRSRRRERADLGLKCSGARFVTAPRELEEPAESERARAIDRRLRAIDAELRAIRRHLAVIEACLARCNLPNA